MFCTHDTNDQFGIFNFPTGMNSTNEVKQLAYLIISTTQEIIYFFIIINYIPVTGMLLVTTNQIGSLLLTTKTKFYHFSWTDIKE